VIGSALALLMLVLTIPVLRGVFRFSALDPIDVAVCVAAGIVSLVAFEATKRFGGDTAKDVPIP
jgi:Ca2+-transporting ATPase